MDERPESPAADPVVATGFGHAVGLPCDPTPHLKVRKSRKFMGPGDELAVVAAGQAAASAGLGNSLGERAGLYLAVGHIGFEESDIELLLAGSVDERGFSMARFAAEGCTAVNPLVTFRCLSNMPAFHISVNLDIQGPYFTTYPGPGQFYLALDEAIAALERGSIDVALVGGVAYQSNFLVRHHFRRVEPPMDALLDAAGCLVLERASRAQGRARARLVSRELRYRPHNPFEESIAPVETGADPAMGPASLPVALARTGGMLRHELASRDGIVASSAWVVA